MQKVECRINPYFYYPEKNVKSLGYDVINYIYLDNAAAMQVDKEMLERFSLYALEYFPNPEAEHAAGRNCRKELVKAGERLSLAVTGTDDYTVFWTNSATEAMNLAFSFPQVFKGSLLTSKSEHPSFEKPLNKIKNCDLRTINIKRDGTFDMADLKDKLDETVSAVAIHHVQNETGAIQDLSAIRKAVNQKAPNAILIADTVQSVGKIPIPWQEADINIAFIAGHKLGVPTGGALLYRFSEKSVSTVFAKHLAMLRSSSHAIGRVDPPVALTLTDAVEAAEKQKASRLSKVAHLNSVLREKLIAGNLDIEFLINQNISTPYIASLILPYYQGQVLVRMLSDEGVMVSEGSACEAASKEVSPALLAMGLSYQKARSVIRVSFGFQSDESDLNAFIAALEEVLSNY
jgi:cysteine desulfurase